MDIEKVLDIITPNITKITNLQYSEEFPLLGDEYVDECTVRRILRNYIQLAEVYNEKHKKKVVNNG
jgi:hypothetical protein